MRPRGARPQLKRDPLGGDIKLSTPFRVLPGLPAYGAPAIPCPRHWGHRGGEGFVVAFNAPGAEWVGNFGRGLSSKDAALAHPDGHRVLVIAGGALYEVDPGRAEPIDVTDCCVTEILHIPDLNCFVFARNHVSLMRWDADGKHWDTGRISWDGFAKLRPDGDRILGEAWSAPDDQWLPFEVDLETGETTGGAEQLPDYKNGRRLTSA